jgi:hypothetical protein
LKYPKITDTLKEVKLSKQLTTVTPFSRYLALSLFILFPIIGFYEGMQYQKINTEFPVAQTLQTENPKMVISQPTQAQISDQMEKWKTYTDTANGFTVQYPPTIVSNRIRNDGTTEENATVELLASGDATGVIVDEANPKFGPAYLYISIMKEPFKSPNPNTIYNAFPNQSTIDKIFALQVGEELDKKTTKEIGGDWDLPGVYKRLPDVNANGLTFRVIENPKGYGGINRLLLLRRNGKVYMTGIIQSDNTSDYAKKYAKVFEQFYSSFKFTN